MWDRTGKRALTALEVAAGQVIMETSGWSVVYIPSIFLEIINNFFFFWRCTCGNLDFTNIKVASIAIDISREGSSYCLLRWNENNH